MGKKNKNNKLDKKKFDPEKWASQQQTEPPDPVEIKRLKAEISRLNKQVEKRQSGESLIIHAVEQAYENEVDLNIPPPPKASRKRNIEIPIIHISDTHIGKITSNYNSAVADLRLQMLAEKTIKIVNMRRSIAKIDEIRVYLSGDMIEGEDIFPTQAHQIEQSVFDQSVLVAPSILSRMILSLLPHFKKVRVCTVSGNHGRNGPRGTRAHPRTNWDNVCYAVTKLMLLGPDDRPNKEVASRLEFEISDEFYHVDRVFDWGNLQVHGNQITGGFAGFPWYGTAKKAWGWIDAIPEPWDYLWFGHFHTYASATLNHRVFLANGSSESDNNYAIANLSAAGFPCQRLAFFDAENGLISDNQIFLCDDVVQRKPQKTKWDLIES